MGDVTHEADVADAVAQTAAELGGLDAVAACAGIEVTGTVTEMEIADWERSLAVNLTGVMQTARHAIPVMLSMEAGVALVAISSDLGVQGAAEWTPYTVAKHGVIGLIRCLALDYGPLGVRANAICPSFVKTPMTDRIPTGSPKRSRRPAATAAPGALLEFRRDRVGRPPARVRRRTRTAIYMVDGGETAGLFLGATLSRPSDRRGARARARPRRRCG